MKTVYRISKCRFIDDLQGTGAAMYGGRWHSKGNYVLYTAATPSLAMLETVVHIAKVPSEGYCMIGLQVPDDKILRLQVADLPENWMEYPAPSALQQLGDAFVRENKYLLLQVPSVLMPEEDNFIINTQHPDSARISVTSRRNLSLDERLIRH